MNGVVYEKQRRAQGKFQSRMTTDITHERTETNDGRSTTDRCVSTSLGRPLNSGNAQNTRSNKITIMSETIQSHPSSKPLFHAPCSKLQYARHIRKHDDDGQVDGLNAKRMRIKITSPEILDATCYSISLAGAGIPLFDLPSGLVFFRITKARESSASLATRTREG